MTVGLKRTSRMVESAFGTTEEVPNFEFHPFNLNNCPRCKRFFFSKKSKIPDDRSCCNTNYVFESDPAEKQISHRIQKLKPIYELLRGVPSTASPTPNEDELPKSPSNTAHATSQTSDTSPSNMADKTNQPTEVKTTSSLPPSTVVHETDLPAETSTTITFSPKSVVNKTNEASQKQTNSTASHSITGGTTSQPTKTSILTPLNEITKTDHSPQITKRCSICHITTKISNVHKPTTKICGWKSTSTNPTTKRCDCKSTSIKFTTNTRGCKVTSTKPTTRACSCNLTANSPTTLKTTTKALVCNLTSRLSNPTAPTNFTFLAPPTLIQNTTLPPKVTSCKVKCAMFKRPTCAPDRTELERLREKLEKYGFTIAPSHMRNRFPYAGQMNTPSFTFDVPKTTPSPNQSQLPRQQNLNNTLSNPTVGRFADYSNGLKMFNPFINQQELQSPPKKYPNTEYLSSNPKMVLYSSDQTPQSPLPPAWLNWLRKNNITFFTPTEQDRHYFQADRENHSRTGKSDPAEEYVTTSGFLLKSKWDDLKYASNINYNIDINSNETESTESYLKSGSRLHPLKDDTPICKTTVCHGKVQCVESCPPQLSLSAETTPACACSIGIPKSSNLESELRDIILDIIKTCSSRPKTIITRIPTTNLDPSQNSEKTQSFETPTNTVPYSTTSISPRGVENSSEEHQSFSESKLPINPDTAATCACELENLPEKHLSSTDSISSTNLETTLSLACSNIVSNAPNKNRFPLQLQELIKNIVRQSINDDSHYPSTKPKEKSDPCIIFSTKPDIGTEVSSTEHQKSLTYSTRRTNQSTTAPCLCLAIHPPGGKKRYESPPVRHPTSTFTLPCSPSPDSDQTRTSNEPEFRDIISDVIHQCLSTPSVDDTTVPCARNSTILNISDKEQFTLKLEGLIKNLIKQSSINNLHYLANERKVKSNGFTSYTQPSLPETDTSSTTDHQKSCESIQRTNQKTIVPRLSLAIRPPAGRKKCKSKSVTDSTSTIPCPCGLSRDLNQSQVLSESGDVNQMTKLRERISDIIRQCLSTPLVDDCCTSSVETVTGSGPRIIDETCGGQYCTVKVEETTPSTDFTTVVDDKIGGNQNFSSDAEYGTEDSSSSYAFGHVVTSIGKEENIESIQ